MKLAKLLRISLLFTTAAQVAIHFCCLNPVALTSPLVSQSQQGMGNSSARAARVYTSRRTAGFVDPKAPVVFEDLTARTALAGGTSFLLSRFITFIQYDAETFQGFQDHT